MSFKLTAQTLVSARENLISASRENLELVVQLKEQARKIMDLEREVQLQATAASQARHALTEAQAEIAGLRAQLPDQATLNAFESLVEYMTAPSEQHPALRVAA